MVELEYKDSAAVGRRADVGGETMSAPPIVGTRTERDEELIIGCAVATITMSAGLASAAGGCGASQCCFAAAPTGPMPASYANVGEGISSTAQNIGHSASFHPGPIVAAVCDRPVGRRSTDHGDLAQESHW